MHTPVLQPPDLSKGGRRHKSIGSMLNNFSKRQRYACNEDSRTSISSGKVTLNQQQRKSRLVRQPESRSPNVTDKLVPAIDMPEPRRAKLNRSRRNTASRYQAHEPNKSLTSPGSKLVRTRITPITSRKPPARHCRKTPESIVAYSS